MNPPNPHAAPVEAAAAALRARGFEPGPPVTLGPAQRAAVAASGPFAGLVEAALQAQALAGTLGLQALAALACAADLDE
ncbi:hypothetical protein [Glycomyces terrestris]|uniref:Uncharacterized protein n=1 Tax=Glycomyces terrestris TaxID=2493553 RepID=A0A426US81_9ACTN|nr:hypothetical protein [Glycomyces terrestris]RRR96069.1 hypothetical protein EIW28_22665 [Glycomyces terrestris]